MIVSTVMVGSVAKMGQYGYFWYMGSPKFSFIYLTMWSLLTLIQKSFLSTTFLQQVYLIDQIELLSNMKQVRITSVIDAMRFNILGTFRRMTNKNLQKKEYIFDIKDCQLDDLDKVDNPLMRINING